MSNRTAPRTDNRPRNPSEARKLRLMLGRPNERWSQRHLAAYIRENPVPNARGGSREWIKKMEQGQITGDTYSALIDFLNGLLEWQRATDRIIPRPFVHEKSPRPRRQKTPQKT